MSVRWRTRELSQYENLDLTEQLEQTGLLAGKRRYIIHRRRKLRGRYCRAETVKLAWNKIDQRQPCRLFWIIFYISVSQFSIDESPKMQEYWCDRMISKGPFSDVRGHELTT